MSSKYEAEKVMDPILRRWFAIDLDPIDVEHNAENAAVDLSWALEGAGLLNNPTIIDEDGVDHICAALIEVGPWDEIDGDGTEASIIADHIRDLGRLLAHDLLAVTPEGEGVYIAPDGTLMRAFPVNAYHPDRDDPDDYDRNVYRLVPIEEATDD